MQLTDLATNRSFVSWESPLTSVLEYMKSDGSPYRVPVVDSGGKFRGIINKRRILEVLIGTRGSAIRGKEGTESLMDEPVFILIDESHQVFHDGTPVKMVFEYMAENYIGHVIVVDKDNKYRGIVEEKDILRGFVGRRLETPVERLMKKEVIRICPEALVYEAAKTMVQRRVRRLPVEKGGILEGILTIGQVVEHIHTQIQNDPLRLEGVKTLSSRVEAISTKEAQTCLPSTELGEAISIMQQKNFSGLPVTTEERVLLGIFTRVDAVVALVRGLGADSMSELMG